jgi:hypothetical protein
MPLFPSSLWQGQIASQGPLGMIACERLRLVSVLYKLSILSFYLAIHCYLREVLCSVHQMA